MSIFSAIVASRLHAKHFIALIANRLNCDGFSSVKVLLILHREYLAVLCRKLFASKRRGLRYDNTCVVCNNLQWVIKISLILIIEANYVATLHQQPLAASLHRQ